jgi:hypothetical protein
MRSGTRRKADRLKIEQRRARVAANLAASLNYRQIASALGCSVGTVSSDVRALLADWRKTTLADAGEYAALELARIDRMFVALWPLAIGTGGKEPNLPAVDRIIALQNQRAKYLGTQLAPQFRLGDLEGNPLPASNVVIIVPDNGRDGYPALPEAEAQRLLGIGPDAGNAGEGGQSND